MFHSLNDVISFYQNSESKEEAISELTKRFHHSVIQEEPSLQRTSKNLSLSWALFLAAKQAANSFVFLEVGTKEDTYLGQILYFSKLYKKRVNLIGIGKNSNQNQEPFLILDESQIYSGQVDILLYLLNSQNLIHHIQTVKIGGFVFLPSGCKPTANLHLLFGVKDYLIYSKTVDEF